MDGISFVLKPTKRRRISALVVDPYELDLLPVHEQLEQQRLGPLFPCRLRLGRRASIDATMSIDSLIFVYVVVFLAALSAIALYYEQRQKRFGPTPSADHVFRCEKCGYVYTDDPDVDRSRCQQCGTLNEAIKF